MPDQMPPEGQYFQLHPVQPPKPKPAMNWGLPIALGLLAIPLLMAGFGFSQQQQAEPTSTPSTSAAAQASKLDATTPQITPSPTPESQPSPTVAPSPKAEPTSDTATLPVASIKAFNLAANFRAAPSLHSQILGVLMHGDLVQLTTDRRVSQDGVIWVPVRFRGQSGWIAQNFIGGQTNAGI